MIINSLYILYFLCSWFPSQGQNDSPGEDGKCRVSWRRVTGLASLVPRPPTWHGYEGRTWWQLSSSLHLVQTQATKVGLYIVEKLHVYIRPQHYTIFTISLVIIFPLVSHWVLWDIQFTWINVPPMQIQLDSGNIRENPAGGIVRSISDRQRHCNLSSIKPPWLLYVVLRMREAGDGLGVEGLAINSVTCCRRGSQE